MCIYTARKLENREGLPLCNCWQNGVCTLEVYTFRKNRPNPHRGTWLRRLPPRKWYTGDSCLIVYIFLGHFVEFTAQYACFLAARS